MAISTKQGRILAAIAFSLVLAASAFAVDVYQPGSGTPVILGESSYRGEMRDAIERNDSELMPADLYKGGASFDHNAETDGAYTHTYFVNPPVAPAITETAGVSVVNPGHWSSDYTDYLAPSDAAFQATMRDAEIRRDSQLMPEDEEGGASFDNEPMY